MLLSLKKMTSPPSDWKSASDDFIRNGGINILLRSVSIRPLHVAAIQIVIIGVKCSSFFEVIAFKATA
jgi:hypothetical protein